MSIVVIRSPSYDQIIQTSNTSGLATMYIGLSYCIFIAPRLAVKMTKVVTCPVVNYPNRKAL